MYKEATVTSFETS